MPVYVSDPTCSSDTHDRPTTDPLLTSWWHGIDKTSALPGLCAGNSPVNGKLPAQRASNAVL